MTFVSYILQEAFVYTVLAIPQGLLFFLWVLWLVESFKKKKKS